MYGPDCAAFVFFILEVLSTAAHPSTCRLAAACLAMLLRQDNDAFVEVMGEIGAPLGDPLDDAEASEARSNGHSPDKETLNNNPQKKSGEAEVSERGADGLELPFEEISELLRDDEDRKMGLEKLGYTNRIMAAMQMFLMESSSSSAAANSGEAWEKTALGLEQLWVQLLLYGNISSPRVARRVAEDPGFGTWTRWQLQRVVLGERSMASLTRPLLLWYRLMRIPAAGRALLRPWPSSSGYETWGLFVILACTVKPAEGISMDAVKALALTFMLVREMVRHGLGGKLLRDVSATLLTDGMRVGAAMILEIWDLATEHRPMPAGKEKEQHRLRSGWNVGGGHPKMEETYFHEAALAAMELCRSAEVVPSSEQEDGARQTLHYLVDATCRHYLATYFTTHPIDCLRLQGTTVETQQHMQNFLSQSVLRSELLSESFLRLSLPLPRPSDPSDAMNRVIVSCLGLDPHLLETPADVVGHPVDTPGETVNAPPSLPREIIPKSNASLLMLLAVKSIRSHANTRLMHAIACGFPAINHHAIVGYAASLSAKYRAGCLGIRTDAASRLLPDEMCTAVEVGLLLQEFTAAPKAGRKPPAGGEAALAGDLYRREAALTALFVLQSMAITKHCLDALPRGVACLLSDRGGLELTVGAHGGPLVGLGQALQKGVATASHGGQGRAQGLAVTGAPRQWVIAPLYDDSFPHKALWATWLRRLLRLHKDVKDVLGWEALLSHTLLWVLPRRQALFANPAIPFNHSDGEEAEEGHADSDAAAGALVDLVIDLAGLLLSPTTREMGFSSAASETLGIALRAFTNPEAEDGLPWPLAVALALTATRCSPSTTLAAVRLLLETPLIPHSGRLLTSSDPRGIDQLQLLDGLLAWKTCHSDCKTPRWSLEEMVSLVQLLGILFAGFNERSEDVMTSDRFSVDDWTHLISDTEGFHAWCLCALAEGFFHKFLNERKRERNQTTDGKFLSMMEREVLRTTLEEIGWEPRVLWPHLKN
ncbi:unnamed protein product [Phytomonas sp. Hart1]|nr:unnamed protein product [Phytomonas sp. Hart1]|eukprot:CCW69830.1 unnamed protein product [Phytomonas sp. isolate Hart1]